jgi:hypothetical protein
MILKRLFWAGPRSEKRPCIVRSSFFANRSQRGGCRENQAFARTRFQSPSRGGFR